MRHAAPIRRALGFRTIFNLVGPLANPAGVRRQLVGVSRPEQVEIVLEVLRRLGTERALVVHGCEGLSDLSVSGPTRVGTWDGQRMCVATVEPAVIGIARRALADLQVRSPAESAALIRRVLAGERGPARDIVVLNTAAALWVAGLAHDWADGATQAAAVIDSGRAAATLAAWISTSNEST
jgi:anthranilate phosphoribosyltransferase